MQTVIFGMEIALIGMGIVFVVLVFLIGVIVLMGKLADYSGKKQRSAESTAIIGENKNNLSVNRNVDEGDSDHREIIAVISAAIACLTGGKGRIVTIKRAREEYVPGWAAAGRLETMKLRQKIR